MATPIKYYPNKRQTPHLPITTTNTLGVIQHTLVPSLGLHSTLSLIAYGVARVSDRLDVKDVLWPSSFVANAWYHALINPYLRSTYSIRECLHLLSYPQRLLLGGVTVWGLRLFGRILYRTVPKDHDDERYLGDYKGRESKGAARFWNTSALALFGMESVVQSVIGLGWSVALRYSRKGSFGTDGVGVGTGSSLLHGLAIGIWTLGFVTEVLADRQLRLKKESGEAGLQKDGVWSIVRHPNYLGDALVHLSFPLLAFADGMFDPIMLLGPIANYLFLRLISGDKENEAHQEQKYSEKDPLKYQQLQEWKAEKNSFWPKVQEIKNPWTLALLGVSAAVAGAEYLGRIYLK